MRHPKNVYDPEEFFHEIVNFIIQKLGDIKATVPEKILSLNEPNHFYMLKAEYKLLLELEEYLDVKLRDEIYKNFFM